MSGLFDSGTVTGPGVLSWGSSPTPGDDMDRLFEGMTPAERDDAVGGTSLRPGLADMIHHTTDDQLEEAARRSRVRDARIVAPLLACSARARAAGLAVKDGASRAEDFRSSSLAQVPSMAGLAERLEAKVAAYDAAGSSVHPRSESLAADAPLLAAPPPPAMHTVPGGMPPGVLVDDAGGGPPPGVATFLIVAAGVLVLLKVIGG